MTRKTKTERQQELVDDIIIMQKTKTEKPLSVEPEKLKGDMAVLDMGDGNETD